MTNINNYKDYLYDDSETMARVPSIAFLRIYSILHYSASFLSPSLEVTEQYMKENQYMIML